jgi:Ca-activated chloride channel family protein
MTTSLFICPAIHAQEKDGRSGVKAYNQPGVVSADSLPVTAHNVVFLLDVSNSMGRENKMQLLHKSVETMLKSLGRRDKIHLITFGNTVETIYTSTSFNAPDSLSRILGKVRSTASATNINGGLASAYETIRSNLIPNGNNEVLLITDGEFVLNKYTVSFVKEDTCIQLTAVIVGKGSEADKAVRYVKQTLGLPVVTLVDEIQDAGTLLNHIRMRSELFRKCKPLQTGSK